MIKEIHLDVLTDTYNGKTGCACGCAGDYSSVESVKGQKRIKRIMNSAKVVLFEFGDGEGCYELENRDGTRAVRVYYKEAK